MSQMAQVFRVQPGQTYVDNRYSDRFLVTAVLGASACLESQQHGYRRWADLTALHTDGRQRSTGYNLATA
jgi:hypothetical protein